MDRLPISKEMLTARAIALPTAEDGQILDDTESLCLLETLSQIGSIIPEHLKNQRLRLYQQAIEEFPEFGIEGHATITYDMFRAFIARVAISAGAQVISDIGEAQRLIEQHNRDFKGN